MISNPFDAPHGFAAGFACPALGESRVAELRRAFRHSLCTGVARLENQATDRIDFEWQRLGVASFPESRSAASRTSSTMELPLRSARTDWPNSTTSGHRVSSSQFVPPVAGKLNSRHNP